MHQCSPVSFPINPPILDCATKDQHPQTYRGSLGATNYYLKKFGKNALHGVFLYPSRPQVGEELAGAGIHGRSSRRASSRTPTFDVSASGAADAVHAVRAGDQGQVVHLRAATARTTASVIALLKEAKLQGVNTVKVWDCSLQCYDKDILAAPDDADRGPVRLDAVPAVRGGPANKMPANFLKYIGKDKADGFSLQAYASGLFLRDVSTPNDGWVSRWVRSPSLVRSSSPSVSWSSRPTGNTRGSAGTSSTTVGRPCGSSAVVTTPAGLLSR